MRSPAPFIASAGSSSHARHMSLKCRGVRTGACRCDRATDKVVISFVRTLTDAGEGALHDGVVPHSEAQHLVVARLRQAPTRLCPEGPAEELFSSSLAPAPRRPPGRNPWAPTVVHRFRGPRGWAAG